MLPCIAIVYSLLGAEPTISEAAAQPDGTLRYAVTSDYQAGTTTIRMLLPDKYDSSRRYRVLLVLPVEAGDEHRYGDGLLEVKKLNVHNTHPLICVQPTFSHLPWYADHPTDPQIRQETYLLKVVLPWLKEHYPVRKDGADWLLLGFSKSGYGAMSLLMRHPTVFGRAAAWDAPLDMQAPNKYGMQGIYETQENFDDYRITTLLERDAARFHDPPARAGIFGYGNFREQMTAVHERMQRLGIAHEFRDGPWREHTWSSGWIPEAVEFLTEGE